MKFYSRSKTITAALLTLSLLATGCNAQWISIALADLPVLVQMALNIGTIVTTLQSGQQLSATEASAIQSISNEASKDLNLLQALYNDYKTAPSSATVQKIQGVIADINTNLPALLQGAHISDAALSVRITAAVNLILTTVNSFASLLPATGPPTMRAAQVAHQKPVLPKAKDLKKQWNEQVCGTNGKARARQLVQGMPRAIGNKRLLTQSFSSPAHADLGHFNHDSRRNEFRAERVGSLEITGAACALHSGDFFLDV